MPETPVVAANDDTCPDSVIAGTLCLMSCYVQRPVALYADRISANLNRMAQFPVLTPELRTICRRLAEPRARLPHRNLASRPRRFTVAAL